MGITVGNVLLSYDVERYHTSVKSEMEKLGYLDNWNYTGGKKNELPNTTLWHAKKSTNQALTDLKEVCRRLNANLERAVAVLATEFTGI